PPLYLLDQLLFSKLRHSSYQHNYCCLYYLLLSLYHYLPHSTVFLFNVCCDHCFAEIITPMSNLSDAIDGDSGDSGEEIPVTELVYSFDWSTTPLGPMSDWPAWLKSTVVSNANEE